MLQRGTEKNWETVGKFDVAVIGAGSAGFGAAVAAARRGLRVALIENYGFAGGVATKSCVSLFFDYTIGGKKVKGNLPEEFARRMDKLGAASLMLHDGCAMPLYAPIGDGEITTKVQFDTETMKLVYRRMLDEAGVTSFFYTRVCETIGENGHIDGLLLSMREGTKILYADAFIDCTGDALVCALADKNAVQLYGEDFNMHKSMFFFVGGVTPFDNEYNRKLYQELYAAGKVPGKVWATFGYSLQLNPGVCQIAVCFDSGNGVSSVDMTAMDGRMRENVFSIMDFLHEYMPGFKNCYLLQTATEIGVRAGQGIIGRDCVTGETVFGDDTHDCIAITSRSTGAHTNEKGKFSSAWSKSASGTGSIPMGAVIPKTLDNCLAAGRCISTEPWLIGTFRMMTTCMTTGEAAGLMCVIAKQANMLPSAVSYAQLRPLLEENRFVLA